MTNRAQRRASTGRATPPGRIPAPPAPSWAHWWDPKRRMWFRHDARVEAFIRSLTEDAPAPPPTVSASLR